MELLDERAAREKKRKRRDDLLLLPVKTCGTHQKEEESRGDE